MALIVFLVGFGVSLVGVVAFAIVGIAWRESTRIASVFAKFAMATYNTIVGR